MLYIQIKDRKLIVLHLLIFCIKRYLSRYFADNNLYYGYGLRRGKHIADAALVEDGDGGVMAEVVA